VLDDGSVIVISRKAEYQVSKSWAGDSYGSHELASTLSFSGDLASLPTWNVALVPLLIYRDQATSEWVIVATANSCEAWYDHGSPPNLYWEFRLRSGAWQETPLSPGSFGRTSNLYFSYERPMRWPFVSREMKEEVLATERIDERYKKILENYRSACG
jgi:hypothetical protein